MVHRLANSRWRRRHHPQLTVAPSITVADTNGTPLTQVTFGKDGHLTAAPKLQVSPSTTVNGVGPRCVKVDLMGRPYASMGACS